MAGEIRDIDKDICIPDNAEEFEILMMQKHMSHISYYWSKVVADLEEKIKKYELAFDIWYAEIKHEAINEAVKALDPKEKERFLKALSVSSIKDLVMKTFKSEYIRLRSEIHRLENERDKMKGALNALEKKHFQLLSLSNNCNREFRSISK